jgi:hypothetical protein
MAHEPESIDTQPSKADIPQTPPTVPNKLATKLLQRAHSILCSMTLTLVSTLLPPQSHLQLPTLILPSTRTIRTTLLTTIHTHPRRTILLVLGLVAEYQQPGFIPRPAELSTLLASVPCAAFLVCLGSALEAWTGQETWESVWERSVGWYWGDEDEAEYRAEKGTVVVAAGADGERRERPVVLQRRDDMSTPVLHHRVVQSTTPTGSARQEEGEAHGFTAPDSPTPPVSVPSPQSTPLLPPDLVLSPLTPSQIHRSGLLGESPMPGAAMFSSEHFSGKGFARRNRVLGKMGVWSGFEGRTLSEWIDEKEEDNMDGDEEDNTDEDEGDEGQSDGGDAGDVHHQYQGVRLQG